MKKAASRSKREEPAALAALKRSAKKALELARQTGTPAYVLEDGAIVDLAKRPPPKKRRKGQPQ